MKDGVATGKLIDLENTYDNTEERPGNIYDNTPDNGERPFYRYVLLFG